MSKTAPPGGTFTWSLTFHNPKNGFVGVYPSGYTVFGVEGMDWAAIGRQSLVPTVGFSDATSTDLTITAPSTPGEYTVENIVPKDGGTVGSDTLTVTTPVAGSGLPVGAPSGGAAGGTPALPIGAFLASPGPGGLPMGAVLGLGALAVWLLGRR